MSILTKSFKINFTQVPNNIINDKNVSLKAKGLYLYMVSKPDTWDFSINGMASQNKDGRDGIINTLNELIKSGYLDKLESSNNGKFKCNKYVLHLEPRIKGDSVQVGKPVTENPSRKSRHGKTDTSNTNTSNTKKVIKNNSLRPERKERDFQSFKRDFIKSNKGVPFFTTDLGWLKETPFVVNDDEYILNTVSKKLLTREDAFKVWKYLYKTT